MRFSAIICILLLICQTILFGCALGKKEWPSAIESEDDFQLALLVGERTDKCLALEVRVNGAVNRLYRASIQYEIVGGGDGEGCEGCPFVPRDVAHFTRGQSNFVINGENLSLSLCNLEPDKQYRFRVAGQSELANSPLVYSDIYVTTP